MTRHLSECRRISKSVQFKIKLNMRLMFLLLATPGPYQLPIQLVHQLMFIVNGFISMKPKVSKDKYSYHSYQSYLNDVLFYILIF